MKAVVISDTHNQHALVDLPSGDLLVHCGDATMGGTEAEVINFADWFSKQDFEHKIFVPGNHDFMFEKMLPLCREMMPDTHILVEDQIEIEHLKIYGVPYVPLGRRWAYSYSRDDYQRAKKIWARVPKNLDLLITHGPPQNILDKVPAGNVGCPYLYESVRANYPTYHCFGHIHEGYGKMNQSGMVANFVNAALLDENYKLVNTPQVIYL
jgi:Icc-related predicted phosphoesterase